ncbi:PmeII family type II restriction endonuclease [Bartonella apihabitans]|uniref:PmeII family type II restriction endonuclease n=1 Tax=uncultured Bartonella sp. TaxID=104108 RepID=UPI0025CE5939|nr:PmeII family type II restriction endonuclease [Bartonella apihabitans]WLT09161.1 PmeII family type II restriction endonuclease [Bartonella apihabitans]
MTEVEKEEIIKKAKKWFAESIAANHIANAKKLENPKEFHINPFTAVYLASFLKGKLDADGIARVLVYPRVLGTSIATSFGMQIQKFTSEVLNAFQSTTGGIDIEFNDCLDGKRKYCQLKAGPYTINKDDIATIDGHFQTIKGTAKANNLSLSLDQFVVGIVYGEKKEINDHYKKLEKKYNYDIFIGKNFWHHLTGDEHFYSDLLEAITKVAIEANFKEELETIISKLADEDIIKELANVEK